MEEKDKHEVMICACGDPQHQIVFNKDTDLEDKYKCIYCTIHLKNNSFWRRVKNGIKYIFGHKSIYGDFDEIILTNKHSEKLKEMYEYLKD